MRPETKRNIQRQIEALRRQMREDANDLEYELHLHLVRDLERLLQEDQTPEKK